jgi:hypothetical protein
LSLSWLCLVSALALSCLSLVSALFILSQSCLYIGSVLALSWLCLVSALSLLCLSLVSALSLYWLFLGAVLSQPSQPRLCFVSAWSQRCVCLVSVLSLSCLCIVSDLSQPCFCLVCLHLLPPKPLLFVPRLFTDTPMTGPRHRTHTIISPSSLFHVCRCIVFFWAGLGSSLSCCSSLQLYFISLISLLPCSMHPSFLHHFWLRCVCFVLPYPLWPWGGAHTLTAL